MQTISPPSIPNFLLKNKASKDVAPIKKTGKVVNKLALILFICKSSFMTVNKGPMAVIAGLKFSESAKTKIIKYRLFIVKSSFLKS